LVVASEGKCIMRQVVSLAVVAAVMVMGLSGVGSAQEPASSTPGPRISGAVSIGDRSLNIDCLGAGSPTVILDAGQDKEGTSMTVLQDALADNVLACVYDRAGRGRSDPPATWPRSAEEVVTDLHALLLAAKVPGPYVLVGQSAGGAFVQLYARTFPDEVVGVVAMNPVPPADPWLTDALPLMTEDERADEDAYYRGELNEEAFDWIASSDQLAAAPPPPALPFLLLISTVAQCDSPDDVCGRTYGVYEAVMQSVAREWPRGRYAQIAGSHAFYDEPEARALIDQVIAAARDARVWATPLAGAPTA
jgi:pimeloyl-ACP methyl ester carboxylesterase